LWEAWPQEGEDLHPSSAKVSDADSEAGLSLFSDFLLVAVAMEVCITAALPAAFMVWRGLDGYNPDG
jgi:hypothetical protein